MRIHAWRLTYVDPNKNSRKFYCVYQSDHGVTRHWGRMGTQGQDTFDEMGAEEARIFARKQVYSKLDKGYVVDEEGAFETDHPNDDGHILTRAFLKAVTSKELVSSNADLMGQLTAFTAQVQGLIQDIKNSSQPTEDLLEVLNGLRQEYSSVKDEIESAESALEIAQLSLMQRV